MEGKILRVKFLNNHFLVVNMSLLKKLFGKKEEKKEVRRERKEEEVKKTLLEELCGEDQELYNALRWVNLDPRGKDPKDYEEKAKALEKDGKLIDARINYWTAGSVYLYEGKAEAAMRCFSKCAELHSKIFDGARHEAFEYLKRREGVDKAIPVLKAYMEKAFVEKGADKGES